SLSSTEGGIYKTLWNIRDRDKNEIEKRFPAIPRRVSGYNLDELIKPGPFNVSKLIAGSEGTLGIITEIKMRIVPKAKVTGLCLIHFDEMLPALKIVPSLLAFYPMALEMIDDQIIQLGRVSPSLRGGLDWLQGNPKALFILEIDAESPLELSFKLNA